MTLEQAIQNHIANYKKRISPHNTKVYQEMLEREIRIFEQTPRNSMMIQRRISQKNKLKDQHTDVDKVQALDLEVEALERLLSMVKLSEEDQPLDGVGY